MTVDQLISAIQTRQADVSVRKWRRCGVTNGEDYPAIFITIDDEGYATGNDNYVTDTALEERRLTPAEEQAVAAAIAARERDNP
jgi:hypothetical protein